MLPNYQKLSNGLIKQLEIKNAIEYNPEYVLNRYSSDSFIANGLGIKMSYLRLGYLLGVLGFTPNSILDYGYGNGDFLKACQNFIGDVNGHDISNYPVPDGASFIIDPYARAFDVVCFFDVLEHFQNPYEIKGLKTNYIYISVPNCHYFSDDWFDTWKHRRPDEHLWHFNVESLVNFFSEIGYECIGLSNIEDTIRKDKNAQEGKYSNILTGVFKKK